MAVLVVLLVLSFIICIVGFFLAWDFRYDPIWCGRFEAIGHIGGFLTFVFLVLLLAS